MRGHQFDRAPARVDTSSTAIDAHSQAGVPGAPTLRQRYLKVHKHLSEFHACRAWDPISELIPWRPTGQLLRTVHSEGRSGGCKRTPTPLGQLCACRRSLTVIQKPMVRVHTVLAPCGCGKSYRGRHALPRCSCSKHTRSYCACFVLLAMALHGAVDTAGSTSEGAGK